MAFEKLIIIVIISAGVLIILASIAIKINDYVKKHRAVKEESRRTYLHEVELNSPKAFKKFDPYLYMYSLNESVFDGLKMDFPGKERKDIFLISWFFESPSGREFMGDTLELGLAWFEEYCVVMEDRFKIKNSSVDDLNLLYENVLASGEEPIGDMPKIYGYRINGVAEKFGQIKIGYTSGSVFNRVRDQIITAAHMEANYEILFIMPAITLSGETFKDHSVHRVLNLFNVNNTVGEWFECTKEEAVNAVKFAQKDLSSDQIISIINKD